MAEVEGRYSRTAALLHWTVAILVLIVSGLALFRETFARVSVDMIGLHKLLGLAILLAALFRLAWRLTHRPPPMAESVRPWERRFAGAVHWLLYSLLIAVPLTGWVFVSLAPPSRPLHYRGPDSVRELPLRTDDAAAFSWHEAHELMGFALIGLFLLHWAGVFRRRWIIREMIITRMTASGWARLLPQLAILVAVLWGIGLALDVFGVRLMGDPLPEGGLLEALTVKD